MDNYLPLPDAASQFGKPEQVLAELARNGIIRSIMLSGAVAVNENDLRAQIPLRERPEYAEFVHLVGQAISMSEAFRRYGVSHSTISRWVKRGVLQALKREGREVLIDEADVATCAKIYLDSGGAQGHWVFRGSSTYSKKRC